MSNNLSFFNDQAIKNRHIEQAKRHYELDMLVTGTYEYIQNDFFRGCSVGCFAHEIKPNFKSEAIDPHQIVAEYLNLPEWLIRLQDTIFEGLPPDERKEWHVQLAEAIPVGKDLEPVRHLLAIRRVNRLITLQQKMLNNRLSVKPVIEQVIAALILVRECHEAELNKNTCDWKTAESAARAAESAAAESAAAWSARFAAWSPVDSAAYLQERNDLLTLLRQC